MRYDECKLFNTELGYQCKGARNNHYADVRNPESQVTFCEVHPIKNSAIWRPISRRTD
jgi:hypothetical protein